MVDEGGFEETNELLDGADESSGDEEDVNYEPLAAISAVKEEAHDSDAAIDSAALDFCISRGEMQAFVSTIDRPDGDQG